MACPNVPRTTSDGQSLLLKYIISVPNILDFGGDGAEYRNQSCIELGLGGRLLPGSSGVLSSRIGRNFLNLLIYKVNTHTVLAAALIMVYRELEAMLQ